MNHKKARPNQFRILSAWLVCLLLLAAFSWLPLAQRLDFIWLDTLTQWRASTRPAPSDIVLIDIDTYSIDAMAPEIGSWPWPRATHAYLIEWLNEQGAKAIAFDIWFSESAKFTAEMDDFFAETLAIHGNVYMPTLLFPGDSQSSAEIARLTRHAPFVIAGAEANPQARADVLWPALGAPESWRLGVINFLSDADGVGRRYHNFIEKDGWQFLSLPAVLARDFGYPASAQPDIRLDWYGQHPPILTRSYADIFQQVKAGSEDTFFKDKFVFIGSTALGNHDLKPTALASQFPAVYMLINAFDNLRRGEQLQYSPWLTLAGGSALLAIFLLVVLAELSIVRVFAVALSASALLLVASLIAIRTAWLLPLISPLLAGVIFLFAAAIIRFLQARDAEQNAVELFGRFMDRNVVRQLVDSGLAETSRMAQQRTLTVLFSDIRGFTSLSEKQQPEAIMALLNDYFSRQVDVIFKHQGTLDKFIGDAIMAFWGAPIDDPKHAEHAVAAALDMADALREFCESRGLEHFDIGIGIHTGPAVVGMIGAQQRMDYTAIGDTVNLASRLEGLTKGVARVLVSEATKIACAEAFDFAAHGAYKVKGREEEVQVYEPKRRPAPASLQ